MICPNCGRNLPDDTKFCGGCGTRMTPPAQQPAPYTEPVFEQPPVTFTDPVFPEPEVPAVQEKPAKPNVLDKVKAIFKKIPAKYLKIGGIAAAALVVVIIVLCILPMGGSGSGNGSGQPDGALYLKDGELYFSDYSKKAPYEITGKLMGDVSASSLRGYAYDIANTIHVTEDGKTMFYMDKLSSDGTGTLYYRSLTNFKQEAVKISGNVSRYTVSKDGKLVTFLKNDTLYQFDMKEEVKLEKDVSYYRVSDDGKIIYYRNSDYTWYVLKNGENEKIGTDVSIEYITEDFSTVYYTNEDKIYKKTIGKDKEKLVSHVEDITGIGEDGTFYYAVLEEVPYSDFVKEDTNEYEGAMEQLSEEFLEFYEIGYYNGKECVELGSDCYAFDMEDGILYYGQYDLSNISTIGLNALVEYYYDSDHYYFTDAAEAKIREQLEGNASFCIAIDGKISVLELENIYDLVTSPEGDTIFALCDVDYEKYIGTMYKVTISGGKIKTTEEFDDDVYISEGGYFAYYGIHDSDYFVYFKDVKDGKGDLYANGVLVDSDVSVGNRIRYHAKDNGLVYYTDFDNEKGIGTLKVWNGKEAVEIYDEVYEYEIMENGNIVVGFDHENRSCTLAVWNGKELTEISDEAYQVSELENGDLLVGTEYSDKNGSYTLNIWNGKSLTAISDDVSTFSVMPDGDILYLYDYSTSKYEGELYRWNGKKAELVDEDVVALIVLPGIVTHYFD